MAGWHHQLDGHEFEPAPIVTDGQGSLACCSPWGCKESDTTEQLSWTDPPIYFKSSLDYLQYLMQFKCYVNNSWGTANSTFVFWNFLEFLFFKYFPSTVGWIHRCRTHRYRGPTGQHLCNRRVYSRSGKQFKTLVGTKCHSVSAAIIKYHRLDGLNNINLLLTFLETRNSKIKVPANSVTGEDSLPGLQMACKWPPSYCVLTWWKGVPSYMGTNPIGSRTQELWPHLTLSTTLRPYLRIQSHWGLELQHKDSGSTQYLGRCLVRKYTAISTHTQNILKTRQKYITLCSIIIWGKNSDI